MNRKLRLALVVLLMAIAIGLAHSAWPPSEFRSTRTEFCGTCGIRRTLVSAGRLNAPPPTPVVALLRTPLSEWYSKNISRDCPHVWQYNHSTNVRYASLLGIKWRTNAEAGSRVTPPLIRLTGDDQRMLDALLAKDPVACRAHIAAQLSREIAQPAVPRDRAERGP